MMLQSAGTASGEEVVGTVGRVIHVEGEFGLGRTPPSIASLASTEQDPLLVRKL